MKIKAQLRIDSDQLSIYKMSSTRYRMELNEGMDRLDREELKANKAKRELELDAEFAPTRTLSHSTLR